MQAAVSALALVGCVQDGGRLGRPDAASSAAGRVAVRLSLPRGGDPQVTASAVFVRFAGIDADAAARLAGAEVPVELAPGRCARVSTDVLIEDALDAATPDAKVVMLDAGDLAVRAAGRLDRLTPRWMPELLPFVSGVTYADEGGAVPGMPGWGDGDEVTVSGFGGAGVGPFDASLAVPPLPRVAVVGGVTPGDDPVVVDRDGDLEIRWSEAGPSGDEVSVELDWGLAGQRVRCRPVAAGRVSVPHALLVGIEPAGGEPIVLSVERTRRGALGVDGVDAAELTVSARDVVPLRWRDGDGTR